MKYLLLMAVAAAVLLTGCATEEECLANGHEYVTQNLFGSTVNCADLNRDTLIVDTYDSDDEHLGAVMLEDLIGVRKIGR